MAEIKNEKEYEALLARIEELLPQTWQDGAPEDSKENIELALISEMVADYEDIHYPITPKYVSYMKQKMNEKNITQKKAAEMLGISPSKLSGIMNGKIEPSLSLGRRISQKLEIEPKVILSI